MSDCSTFEGSVPYVAERRLRRREDGSMANALIILFALFAVSSLTQTLYGSLPLNKVIGFSIAVVLAYWFASRALTHMRVIAAVLVGLAGLSSVLYGVEFGRDFSDYIYFVTTLLMLLYASDQENRRGLFRCFTKHADFLMLVALVLSLLLTGLLILGIGYGTSWGGERYFSGLANNEHALASSCCLLLSIGLLYGKVKRHGVATAFVIFASTLAILATGARTYLIPLAIVLLVFVRDVAPKKWIRVLLLVLVMVLFAGLVLESGMAEKFQFAMGNEFADSLLSAFSNGRNEIWANDIALFLGHSFHQIMFGGSFSEVYLSNSQELLLYIWSHDDFIMLLCSVGVVGLSIYLVALSGFFRSIARSASFFSITALVLYVLVPAILNGFYPYQHLVYAAVLFSICITDSGFCGKGESRDIYV